MHASVLVRACAGVIVTVAVGCTSSTPEPDADLSSDALRALAPAEIVGDLRYGQTSASVAYTENPKYRAFRFQGRAGDAIDAWVRSTSGDARGWLLDAQFKNVVSNDNASTSTLDSHLVATLTQSGAYYIAFREATLEDASFTVSLAGTTSVPSPTCDPEEENCPDGGGGPTPAPTGIFETNPCTGGTPLTLDVAARYFAPAALVSDKVVAQGTFHSRKRICNAVSGCAPWQDEAAPLIGQAAVTSLDFHAKVRPGAHVVLDFSANGDDKGFCFLDGSCHLYSFAGGVIRNDVGIARTEFDLTITTSCVYTKMTGSVSTGRPSETAHSEVVFVGTVNPPTH